MKLSWSLSRTVAASLLATAVLAGCGTAPSAASSTPPSKTSQPPVTVTVTHTVIAPPASTGIGAFNPNAPTNIASPVPLTIQGMSYATATSTITVGYNFSAYYQWSLFSLTLWVFGNPEGSYTQGYWNAGNTGGDYTFQPPMALQNTTVRVIAQFLGPKGQIVTEYGPKFTVH